jgi:hypothetical protein
VFFHDALDNPILYVTGGILMTGIPQYVDNLLSLQEPRTGGYRPPGMWFAATYRACFAGRLPYLCQIVNGTAATIAISQDARL